jgi:hypothetical protein
MTLTLKQVHDLAQMSPAMWDMLRSVKLYRGGYSRPPGTAEMLARSGFIEMTKRRPDADGFYSARLTEAGAEALARSRPRASAARWRDERPSVSCLSSCLTSAARCGGTGLARASY